jgi:hypothetical protein
LKSLSSAFLAKIDLELTSWIDDLNVQRNDQVHRLAEAIANLLAPLPRR